MNRIIDLFYDIKHFMYRYFIIKYHNVPFYRVLFWRLLWQHITKGYDESATWGLYYNIAKWVYPRLLLFYDKIKESGACPYDYERSMIDVYIQKGFKYDKSRARFEDLKVEKKMHQDALENWKTDVWSMCEAFRDILAEEEDYFNWEAGWRYYSKKAEKEYDKFKTAAGRKKYWELFEFDREWHPAIRFTPYDFSEKYQDKGLKLFAEHFQSLWW